MLNKVNPNNISNNDISNNDISSNPMQLVKKEKKYKLTIEDLKDQIIAIINFMYLTVQIKKNALKLNALITIVSFLILLGIMFLYMVKKLMISILLINKNYLH